MNAPVPRHRCRLDVFADYHQFYLWDPDLSDRQPPPTWTDEDVTNRAKAAGGAVVICPVRNMNVPVELGIWDGEPALDTVQWQHIVEAPLVSTGMIELHECTGGALAAFSVEAGDFTVRALYRGLDTLSEDGLAGGDHYEVQIWRARCPALTVVKRWP